MLTPFARRLQNLPIRTKLACLLGILLVNLTAVIAVGAFGMSVLSSLRAYVGGEGLWAKAQKNAILSLNRYAATRDEADYKSFESCLIVPLGDRRARLALQRPEPDVAAAESGFLQGGNHPDDVHGLAMTFLRFRRVSYIKRAVGYWTQGDALVIELQASAAALHKAVAAGSAADVRRLLARIGAINEGLTEAENRFSYSLGEGSRWAQRTLLETMLAGSLLLAALSLWLSLLISGAIAAGVRGLSQAAGRAAKGDLTARVRRESDDELGGLADVFNRMVGELERSNADLEAFAFTAAHDLQEPLRKIVGFSEVLESRAGAALDGEMRDVLNRIVGATKRMQGLIDDLLKYSRVARRGEAMRAVPAGAALERALSNLETAIKESGASVTGGELPTVNADESQLVQLLQNLVGNAVKFRAARPPEVRVSAERRGGEWVFAVRDNGIGFEMRDSERIFTVFERLHSRAEYPGTGIGLAICKKIVERHGGRIWAESQPGRGSAFFFTLPA